jgi:PAS domain S-box-containing protein
MAALPSRGLLLSERPLARYALACIAVTAAALVRLAAARYIGSNYPFLTFFPAVLVTATLAGLWPGVLATSLAVALAWWTVPRPWHIPPDTTPDAVRLILFIALGVATSVVARLYLRDRQRAAQYEKAVALRDSEERFRVAFQISPDAIDISRIQDGVYVSVNEGFSRMMGWSEDEVVGRSSLELGTWEDPAGRDQLLAGLDRDGLIRNLEARLRTKHGGVVPVLISAQILTLRGQQYLLSVARDISEWKRADEERSRLKSVLYEAAKIEAIGQLAGGIAHDFNNLLTVILSGAAELKHDTRTGSPLDSEIVEEILGAAERARELTRQLLAFARRQVIAPAPIDMNDLVRGCEKLLRRLLGEDVQLLVLAHPALWTVRCDPGQIEQVIVNLAVNARDAMPAGGKLKIETANVELDAHFAASHPFIRPGPYARLSVRDSGHGMSPEVKAHAFEPFFTTKPVGKGTGLGLATVYGIVKQSEGYILVESEPGQGAEFALYFPRIAEAAAVAAKPPGPVVATHGTETVLVVEDDPHVRESTVRSLRGNGYSVLTASNGAEALDLGSRKEEPVHLLVTDVVMPGLDGPAVADALRHHHPEMRVLYVSGHAEGAIVHHGVLEPGIEFLPKPFTASSLLARVRAVLDANPSSP